MSCNCQEAASILARCHGQAQPRQPRKNEMFRSWTADITGKPPKATKRVPPQATGEKRARVTKRAPPQATGEKRARKTQAAPATIKETKKLDSEQEKKMKDMQSYIDRLEKLVEEPKGLSQVPNAMPQSWRNALAVAQKVQKNIKKYDNKELASDAQAIQDEIKDVKEKYKRLQQLKKRRASKLMKGQISGLKKATLEMAQSVDRGIVRASKNFAQVGRKGPRPKFKGKKQNTGRSGKRRK